MTLSVFFLCYILFGERNKRVKIFDESHEKDLERDINEFLCEDIEVMDIKFSSSVSIFSEEQIYCFSALILYIKKDK